MSMLKGGYPMKGIAISGWANAVILLAASVGQAGEGPVFDVVVDDLKTIYTATEASSSVEGFKPHVNFPHMVQRWDGSLLTWFNVGQTHGAGTFSLGSQSFDDGQTWSTPGSYTFHPIIAQYAPPGETTLGFRINASDDQPFNAFREPRYTSTDGGHTWTHSPADFSTGTVNYQSVYQNPGDVIVDGSTMLISAFGKREGSSTFETLLFASEDNGLNWTRRSTIAAYVPGHNTSMGSEGPNETGVVQLDNGNLLAVYRTGQPFPNSDLDAVHPSIFFSLSSDLGHTWTAPKMLGVMGQHPNLYKLDDGSVAMTYGRYGTKIMFADETGTRWSTPTVIHDGSTSGFAPMHQRSDGKWTMAYDHSSFYPPSRDASPPADYVYANDEMAHLKIAILDLQRQTVPDAFPWTLEYHGDVTPDSLGSPWTASISGDVSAYLWADQGQDYMRFDTGENGTARSLRYTLAGEDDNAWSDVNFIDGLVVELRARVALESTAQGAAGLFLGDGDTGYISLELTGAGVNLEGLGGNSGQVTYAESLNPGFSTADWHTYRLVLGLEEGDLLARLYVDGDFDAPILTQRLNPALVDEIRIGDQTSTNNGAWDVDFLRFATAVPEPASALCLGLMGLLVLSRRGSR